MSSSLTSKPPEPAAAQNSKPGFPVRSLEPFLAYLTIFALQIKTMWSIWQYKDITFGDTCCYFLNSCRLAFTGHVDFAWSPLYAAFGALLLRISDNAYLWCLGERTLTALATSILVLAFYRRMMPPIWAWLGAAWWALLPVNFNTLYEVHLFSALLVVLCLLLSTRCNTAKKRASLVGLLILLTILVRNELSIVAGMFGAACLFYEYRTRLNFKKQLLPYVTSAAIAFAGIFLLFVNSDTPIAALKEQFKAKHCLNVAQIYAYGYQQRHHDYTVNPWTDFGDLTKKTFGVDEPSMAQAFLTNPKAWTDHCIWNARLIPAGLQVLLFGSTCFRYSPDYMEVTRDATIPPVLSWLTILTLAAGALSCLQFKSSVKRWIKARAWTLVLMGSLSLLSVFIMLTQRPRSSYLFTLEITLIMLVMLSASQITKWISRFAKTTSGARKAIYSFAVATLLVTVLCLPSYYERNPAGRAMRNYYKTLYPFKSAIFGAKKRVLVPNFPLELSHYLLGPLHYKAIAKGTQGTELVLCEQYVPGNFKSLLAKEETGWIVIDRHLYGPDIEGSVRSLGWKPVVHNEGLGILVYAKPNLIAASPR